LRLLSGDTRINKTGKRVAYRLVNHLNVIVYSGLRWPTKKPTPLDGVENVMVSPLPK